MFLTKIRQYPSKNSLPILQKKMEEKTKKTATLTQADTDIVSVTMATSQALRRPADSEDVSSAHTQKERATEKRGVELNPPTQQEGSTSG